MNGPPSWIRSKTKHVGAIDLPNFVAELQYPIPTDGSVDEQRHKRILAANDHRRILREMVASGALVLHDKTSFQPLDPKAGLSFFGLLTIDDVIAFCARVEVHLRRDEPLDDPGKDDREEALRRIKAVHMGGRTVVAEDADDEAKALAGRMDAEREMRFKAEVRRLAAGRYFIEEAAIAIAQQRGLRESEMLQFCDAMVNAAQQGALTVRHPSTWLPVPPEQWISMARIVTRADVNAWLDAQGAGYRWEAEAAPAVAGEPESSDERQYRRFDRLRTLGGDRVPKQGGGWKASGTRGALAALAREEAQVGHPYSDVRDVARDLDAAADRHRASRAMPRG